MNSFKHLLFAAALLIGIQTQARIIYVDIDATGTADGSSWANAHTDLQNAIDDAVGGDSIWVAEGTYLPVKPIDVDLSGGTDQREATFAILDSVKVFGGFNGTESMLSERDFMKHETILSGDIGTAGDTSDNAYHVLLTVDVSRQTLVSGVTITLGHADQLGGNNLNYHGAGWLNVTSGNTTSSPAVEYATFFGNQTLGGGAGMANWAQNSGTANTVYTNCTFSYNSSQNGAIMNTAYNLGTANMTAINCLFIHNEGVNGQGGAIHNDGRNAGQSNATVVSCTFYNNHSRYGGDIYNDDATNGTSQAYLRNNIHWNTSVRSIYNSYQSTTDIDYCLIQEPSNPGGCTIGSNMIFATAPTFVDSIGGDFRLDTSSVGIDFGSNGENSTDKDLAGKTRIQNGVINLGAYEGFPCVNSQDSSDVSSCDTMLSPSGKFIMDSTGVYMDTIMNAGGCDSVITLNFTRNSVNTQVLHNSDTLVSLEVAADYQWFDCDAGNFPVSGATDAVFLPSKNGNYGVAVTKDGCTDSSACFEVVTVGIQKSNKIVVQISPNPTQSFINVNSKTEAQLIILNTLGQEVRRQIIAQGDNTIDLDPLNSGVYFIEVRDESGQIKTTRLLKE